MKCWHLTFSSSVRDPLFPSELSRRKAVCALARVAGRDSVVFCLVDDHAHLVVLCDRRRAGRLAGALHQSRSAIAATVIVRAHIRAVEGRSHMRWLVRYVLTQPQKHGLTVQPAVWTGSCFPDLVGARLLPGLGLLRAEALPRFQVRTAYELVGLAALPLQPASNDLVRAIGMAHLVSAAASAFAVAPDLSGKSAGVVLAKRAVAHVAASAGVAASEIAWALNQPARSVKRLGESAVGEHAIVTLRRRLALENAVTRSLTAATDRQSRAPSEARSHK